MPAPWRPILCAQVQHQPRSGTRQAGGMMKRKAIGIAVALVAMAMITVVSVNRIGGSSNTQASTNAPASDPGANLEPDGDATGVPAEPAVHRALHTKAASDERIQIGDRLWDPKTREEADWLHRNGYPSWEQAQLYNGTGSPQDLPEDLRARSAADVVLAEKVARTNRAYRDQAIAVIQSAADQGSIYALETFARIFESENGPGIQSEAYYRAAVMRGNWGAGLHSDPRLNARDRYFADVRAFEILQNMNRRRAAAGLPPLGRDVRHGLDDAIELIQTDPGS